MSGLAERKHVTNYSSGPGGMHCPCCGEQMSPRKAKPRHRRILRRRDKVEIKQMLREEAAH